MLKLPDVTLVLIETRCHELGKLAIRDCLRKVEFGEVLIFSDKKFGVPGATEIEVEDWDTKLGWSEFLWLKAPAYVKTSQALLIQWDSWVFNPDCWRDEFATFDHIGPPWWYTDGYNVGNTGFSLRSQELMRWLAANPSKYPVSDPEDMALSRLHRRGLEIDGFKYAPDETALDFAFECVRRSLASQHFGFHALRNWPAVLTVEELSERTLLALQNQYIVSSGMLKQFGAGPPWYITGTKPNGRWQLSIGVP